MRFDDLIKKPAKPQRSLTYTESLQAQLDAQMGVKFTAVEENFADGKNPGRKGLAKRSGVNTKASVSDLRKTAKNSTGEKARMAHWMANMKAGRAKKEDLDEGWRDTVGNLAIAGGVALGGVGGMAAKDALTSPQKSPTAPTTQQVTAPAVKKELPKVVAKQAAPTTAKAIQVTAITSNPLENVLLKAAKGAGLKGAELAAFMAQCAHETLDFKRLTEFGGSLDFRKYDPKYAPKKAKALGNKVAGDGARYKGRGFIQITGRYNYKKAGEELGLPLEKNPELAEKPEIAAKIAVWFWQHRVQPNVDNFHDVPSVTKTINPGMRGLEDRKDNFKAYMQTASANRDTKDAS